MNNIGWRWGICIELEALIQQARDGLVTFLSNVYATDATQPFDLTFMLENPDFDTDVTTGWTSNNGTPGYDAKCAEFYEKAFNFYQILDNMPSGDYQLNANAFQRPGSAETVYAPYNKGTAKITSLLYINNTSAPVHHICDDRQPSALFNDGGWGSDQQMADGTFIPNCMTGAAKYFAQGLYDSSVEATLATAGGKLRVGIKCTSAPSYYWTIFDHFRLFFFGNKEITDDIREVNNEKLTMKNGVGTVYDVSGRQTNALHRGFNLIRMSDGSVRKIIRQ